MLEIAGGIIVAVVAIAFWPQIFRAGLIAIAIVAVLLVGLVVLALFPRFAATLATVFATILVILSVAAVWKKVDQESALAAETPLRRTIRTENLPIVDIRYPAGAAWFRKYASPQDNPEDLKPGFRIMLYGLEGFRAGQLVHLRAVGEDLCYMDGKSISREIIARISRAVSEEAILELADERKDQKSETAAI